MTPWTVACQDPLSIGFSRTEYWSGLPCPPPANLPNPGIEPKSPALQADCLLSEPSTHMRIIYSCPFIQISPQALCFWPQSDLCVLSESLLFTPRPWEPGLIRELLSSQLEPSFQTLMSDSFSSHMCVCVRVTQTFDQSFLLIN